MVRFHAAFVKRDPIGASASIADEHDAVVARLDCLHLREDAVVAIGIAQVRRQRAIDGAHDRKIDAVDLFEWRDFAPPALARLLERD